MKTYAVARKINELEDIPAFGKQGTLGDGAT
jgi:hypothetical protein